MTKYPPHKIPKWCTQRKLHIKWPENSE